VKTTPAAVRIAARDRRIVTFTLNNTLHERVAGSLQFDLPAGVAVKPEKPTFGPIEPGSSATVGVTIASDSPGRHTVPYRISYRAGRARRFPLRRCAYCDDRPDVADVYEYRSPIT
jgi:hypothetical protein